MMDIAGHSRCSPAQPPPPPLPTHHHHHHHRAMSAATTGAHPESTRKRQKELRKEQAAADKQARKEEKQRRRAAADDEEDLRVLLAASHLQGHAARLLSPSSPPPSPPRSSTSSTSTSSTSSSSSASSTGGDKRAEKKKRKRSSKKEAKLEKRERKKEEKQRKEDLRLLRQREKRACREHGCSGDVSRLRCPALPSADGRGSRHDQHDVERGGQRVKRSFSPRRKAWRASIACLTLGGLPTSRSRSRRRRSSSAELFVPLHHPPYLQHLGQGEDEDEDEEQQAEIREEEEAEEDETQEKASQEEGKGKERISARDQGHHGQHEDHRLVGEEEDDEDPAKKSGPGKILEEGTLDNGGENAGNWSEEAVFWCGVRYARHDLPPFDVSGLRSKTAYNPNHSLWLATAAALAYRSPAQIRHVVTRIWQWTDMEFFHDAETDTQGFGMYGKECIIICFRGTESSRDWSINLRISETEPFPWLPGLTVHNGFNQALLSVLDQVIDFICKARSANPSLPLYITGHSLGGALANLCLAYFLFSAEPQFSACQLDNGMVEGEEQALVPATHGPITSAIKGVYTFGQPKVGNEKFAYEVRVRAASQGTVFFRLTNNNDPVPFVPRRLYTHCGTRLFLSGSGHIVQGEEAARPAREFWRKERHTASDGRGLILKRRRQGLRDHLVKSYVTFLREHYRFNEAILLSPLRKDVPLLRYHDIERAKLSCEDLRSLVSFDSVIEGLRNMTISDLMDPRSLTMTAKQRKKQAQDLGRKWLRDHWWEKVQAHEEEQIRRVYKLLKGELDKTKTKLLRHPTRSKVEPSPPLPHPTTPEGS